MSIELTQIHKSFSGSPTLKNINLSIASGEMVALLGPSGSGKTTLLRIIAGLASQDSGRILFNQRDVSHLPARDRRVGFVFQHYALFRHMSVFDNIAFGLTVLPRSKRASAGEIQKQVYRLLEMVQLTQLSDRYPAQLSGGQKQRVALARALAVQPEILLLDEPFGALDAQVRKELRRWLRQLHQELNFTSVFVTHDQDEAMEVASKLVLMRQGGIEQQGESQSFWQTPNSRFVMEFMGEPNRLQGYLSEHWLRVAGCYLPLQQPPNLQGEVVLYLRPWDISVSLQPERAHQCAVTVIDRVPRGHYWQLILRAANDLESEIMVFYRQQVPLPDLGSEIYLSLAKATCYQGEQRQDIRLAN